MQFPAWVSFPPYAPWNICFLKDHPGGTPPWSLPLFCHLYQTLELVPSRSPWLLGWIEVVEFELHPKGSVCGMSNGITGCLHPSLACCTPKPVCVQSIRPLGLYKFSVEDTSIRLSSAWTIPRSQEYSRSLVSFGCSYPHELSSHDVEECWSLPFPCVGAAQSSWSLSSGLCLALFCSLGAFQLRCTQNRHETERMFSLPFPSYWSQGFSGLMTTLTCWTSVFRGQSARNLRALSAVTTESAKLIP